VKSENGERCDGVFYEPHINRNHKAAMTSDQLQAALTTALADRQLLNHPFYRRWESGTLQAVELGDYAAQYRHFEAALPGILRALLTRLETGAAKELVQRNLADEESNPAPHVALFADFANAVGSLDAPPTERTASLVVTYRALIESSAAEGLAALVAYEMQAPAVAASKAAGLRRHYGIDAAGTRFWDIHATMDEDHARWGTEALAALGAPDDRLLGAARSAADAWWAFLDERELAVAVPARGDRGNLRRVTSQEG
jgi:pyrroloquinoline-quinone synthase